MLPCPAPRQWRRRRQPCRARAHPAVPAAAAPGTAVRRPAAPRGRRSAAPFLGHRANGGAPRNAPTRSSLSPTKTMTRSEYKRRSAEPRGLVLICGCLDTGLNNPGAATGGTGEDSTPHLFPLPVGRAAAGQRSAPGAGGSSDASRSPESSSTSQEGKADLILVLCWTLDVSSCFFFPPLPM